MTSMAAAGGIVLAVATVVALAWANSPWAAAYTRLWETALVLGVGAWSVHSTLHHLINDGLMAVLFFLVGLEIKREMIAGELKTLRSAALPMMAAVGGMIVPAALYVAINRGGEGAAGWGVPMATDIAFALGVLALLGNRVPLGLKVFLSALAIVDDIGAVLVIAIFYATSISWGALGLAGVLVLVAAALNRAGIRTPWAFAIVGIALWAAVLASGVHATVAGVALAMTIPVRTRLKDGAFLRDAQDALDRFSAAAALTAEDPDVTVLSNHEHHESIEELEVLSEHAQPPLIRIERGLRGLVAFGIMPLFALANAGVSLTSDSVSSALTSPVALGVIVGLALGKPLGITAFAWLAVRLRIAVLPSAVSWGMIAGTGVLGGIGFTMALFIAGLAFTDSGQLDAAKVGVLAASTIAGVVGAVLVVRSTSAIITGSPSQARESSVRAT